MKRRHAIKQAVLSVMCAMCAASLAGCRKSDQGSRNDSLSSSDIRAIIDQLTEIILPETDTPGAKTSGAGDFVMKALNDCYPEKDRERFFAGINELDRSCRARFGNPFLRCTANQQFSMVEELDREALGFRIRIRTRLLGYYNYFRTLKKLTLLGYFTSREGATTALSYEQIPGRWIACEVIKPGQKGWATE